jgi:hypothetical protein
MGESHLLGDHAAERESDDMKPFQAESIAKCHGIARHFLNGARRFASRAGDACVVEENDVVGGGETFSDRRIPVVQVACEIVQEKEWQTAPLPPTTVSKSNTAGFDKLRRRR